MPLKVKIASKAQFNFDNIRDYLNYSFGEDAFLKFKAKTFSSIELLSIFPQIGTLENKKKLIYGFVSSKFTTIFYRFDAEVIIILNVFDNRQNPIKK
jgi:plasmid stabilization system protein ParE